MATNTTVLIVVAAMAALVLAGMIVGVAYKTRTEGRRVKGETIPDQAEEDALRLRRQQALADEYAARAHAAQVEIDIKTIRTCSLQHSDSPSRRGTHLPRPTERADGQRRHIRCGGTHTRTAPARSTHRTPTS